MGLAHRGSVQFCIYTCVRARAAGAEIEEEKKFCFWYMYLRFRPRIRKRDLLYDNEEGGEESERWCEREVGQR